MLTKNPAALRGMRTGTEEGKEPVQKLMLSPVPQRQSSSEDVTRSDWVCKAKGPSKRALSEPDVAEYHV